MKRSIFLTILTALISINAWATIKHYTTHDGLPTNEIWQIIKLPNKQILVQSAGTFHIFNGKSFEPIAYDKECAMPLTAFADYGKLWQGDSLLWLRNFYNLYLFDTKTNTFKTNVKKWMKSQKVIDFANNKIVKPHFNAGRYQHIVDLLPNSTNLHPSDACTDHEGGVWIATINDGIYYWHKTAQRSTRIELADINCMATCSDHEILIGRSNDILLFDTRLKTVSKTIVSNSGFCLSMYSDGGGTIWIASKNGLYRYCNGTTTLFDQSNTRGLVHSNIRFARPIDNDRLLVCNLNNALGYLYPAKRLFINLSNRIPCIDRYRVLVGCERMPQSTSHYIIYTQNGMFCFDTKTNRIVGKPMFDDKYDCLFADSKKRIWIGTPHGLALYDHHGLNFSIANGLKNKYVKNITEDHLGNLWIGTAMGISKLSIRNNEASIVNYWQTEEMTSSMTTERASLTMPSGDVWIADKDGLTCINANNFQVNANKQLVEITNWYTAQHSLSITKEEKSLKYDDNDIYIQFSTLNYSLSTETRYRYRLVGLDTAWTIDSSMGMGNAHFKHLSPGSYTFEVQAAYDNENWGPSTKRTFVIEPPIWLTWWAKAIYLLAIILALGIAINEYLKRQAKILARKNDEKVNKLFELREKAREQFAKSTNISAEKLSINSEEEMLMEKLLKAIENNMGNTEYTVDQMAADVCLSRSNLYRRMQTMLGITPNDFLRNVRLKHAAKLLSETSMTVSEVAILVGFNSPRYFSQYFKKMFGMTPSEYAARRETK